MLGFLIRKSFYDLWDNMFRIVLVNLGFIASMAIPVFVPQALDKISPVLGIVVFFAGLLWVCVYLAAASRCIKTISDYSGFGFADFLAAIKAACPAGLFLGAAIAVTLALVRLVIPFYLSIKSPIGVFLAALIFWVLAAFVLSFQYFLAIRARIGKNNIVSVKKSFIIFADNTGFSITMFVLLLAQAALSVILAFLLPGPGGILLFVDEALRLRLLKYDWLEEHPGENRKKIPWEALLIDERERTGSRTLRNFIFPWKD